MDVSRLLRAYSRGRARDWPLTVLGWNLAVAGALCEAGLSPWLARRAAQ